MKGAITLGIYVAIVLTGAAFGQESIHPMNTTPMSMQTIRMPPATIPPGWKAVPLQAPIVISRGLGGRVDEHRQRFVDYRLTKTKVEIRGPCYSACTIVLTYVEPDHLCIAEGAFMAFHAVRSMEHKTYMPAETQTYYIQLPPPIRQWIDRSGGWQALPLDGFWTMYDRELWSMGYPKCN